MNRRLQAGVALVLVALLAPALAPHDPIAVRDAVEAANLPPSTDHLLGTDPYSRDILSRVLYGARVSLGIATLAVVLSITLGLLVGLAAGLGARWLDTLLMRTVDAGLAIPRIFLLLVVLTLWEGVSIPALVVVLGITGWFGTSRLVRAEVLSVRTRPFMDAARAAGAPPARLVLRHVLPNVATPVIVSATLGVGYVILVEAGLSYLGLGVPQPTPSWGNIIRDGQDFLFTAPWTAAAGGGAVVLTVLSFTLLGDGVQEHLDPRTR